MSSNEDIDYSEIRSALSSIGLSAVLIFGATLLSQGLGFLTRISMARYLPVDGYGNVVLGISLLNILGIAALAGFPKTLSRYIPREDDEEERRAIITSSFQIVLILSISLTVVTFLLAEPISVIIFNNKDIVWIFQIFALILPFYTTFKLSIGGFRGYERTKPQVITDKVMLPGLQLIGILLFVSLGYNTEGIAFAYALSFSFVGIVGAIVVYRIGNFSIWDIINIGAIGRYRELLMFSVPLAISGGVHVVAKHSDILILGIYRDSGQVGKYEVAFRMGLFVVFLFSPSIRYLFQPLVSKLDANDDKRKIQQLYTVTTRWVVVATFPVFGLLVLFPSQTLGFFFGASYTRGAIPLSILATGFMISLIPGLTGSFLTAIGKTKTIMYISIGTALLNIIANFAFIPHYGILGAAIATAGSRIINDFTQWYLIVKRTGIHPFKREYTVPLTVMSLLMIGIYISPMPLNEFSFIEGFLTATALSVLYIVVLLLTKSIYAVEVDLVESLFKRVGVTISLKNRLRPFIR